MKHPSMQLLANEVHLYTVHLAGAIEPLVALLSEDERQRADSFRQPLHRERFIIARAHLRMILSQYLDLSPAAICFQYNEQRKPSLASPNPLAITFNLAHSADIAIYAIASKQDLGVDIEYLRPRPTTDIANRFFSEDEKKELAEKMDPDAKQQAFYHLWACKEALLKASGKGLTQPLSSFSVPLNPAPTQLLVDQQPWYLMPLSIHEDYKAALASNQPIHHIAFYPNWRYDGRPPQDEHP